MTTEAIQDQLSSVDLLRDYKTLKRGRERTSMATSNWVTTLAHDCEAYAVYNRTVPPKLRRPLKDSLGMIFAEGRDQERAVKRDLLDLGYELLGDQEQVTWPQYQITGRREPRIRKDGIRHGVHLEIKSCAQYTYDSINNVEDLKNHKWSFAQKWYAQVCLYMVLECVERYWMLLKNKSNGQIKIVEFTLGDEELQTAERMLKKAEKVNHLVQIGQAPSESMKISAPDLCSECEFFQVCMPELNFGLAAKVLTDEMAAGLAQKTERMIELKPLAKEYEELHEEVTGEVNALCADGGDSVVYGPFVANRKPIVYKAQPAKTVPAKPQSIQYRVSFIKTGA